jgi:small nuclear ribonucleoprotein D3
MTIGVPIKLLHEAQGHIISLELKTGQLYRGKLLEGKKKKLNQLTKTLLTLL